MRTSTVIGAAACIVVSVGVLLAGPASAQSPSSPEHGASAPVQQNQTGPSDAPQGGVIRTPPSEDSGIQKRIPDQNPDNMPVIRPPGTPGGDQSVQPK